MGNGSGIPARSNALKEDNTLFGLQEWTKISQVGQLPGKRSGHSVVSLGNRTYLFGGCGETTDCLGDYFSYDLSSHCWKKMGFEMYGPKPRASFEMILGPIDGTIIIGGGTAKDAAVHGDLFEYNLLTREWREIFFEEGYTASKEFLSLYGMTMRTYQTTIIGFGGSSGTAYSDITVVLDLPKLKCTKLVTTGSCPSPRYKHQALIVEDRMYVLGGGNYKPKAAPIEVYCLGLHTLRWSRIPTSGDVPISRAAHTVLHDTFSSTVFMWGGFNRQLDRLNDFTSLNLNTMTWSLISYGNGPGPSPRAFHAATIHEGTIYIFGGADGDERFDDLWAFRLRASPPSLMVLAARACGVTPSTTPHAGRSRAVSTNQRSRMSSVERGHRQSRGDVRSEGVFANISRRLSRVRSGSNNGRNRMDPEPLALEINPTLVTYRYERSPTHPVDGTLSARTETPGSRVRATNFSTPQHKRSSLNKYFFAREAIEETSTPSSPRNGEPKRHKLVWNSRNKSDVEEDKSFQQEMQADLAILPSELLTGLRGLAFGADAFSHGLPKESRPLQTPPEPAAETENSNVPYA